MNDLVRRLTEEQEIVVSLRPENTVQGLKAAIDRGYVPAKFTGTRGGTELLIPLDRERSDLSGGDFTNGTGTVKIVGQLTLDYTRVRFHGTIDVAALKGTAHLEPLGDVEPGSTSAAQ